MIWPTLKAVRSSLLEFSKASGFRDAHTLVRLRSGGWTRVLGGPGADCVHIHGKVWYQR